MKINVEMMPEYEIAYIRKIGSYGLGNIQTMEKLKTWAMANALLNDESIILGIPWDNPETTKPEDCRYDACLIVEKDQLINYNDVKKGKICEGEYAVFDIEHTAEAVEKAWHELFMELSIHGYKMDDSKPIMERYANKMVKNHKCEICVPIG
ncbi:GyrI-like domain-containing protein [Acetobacterium sp.]|uniref:AraC family transcriptional regulator n=1 Tax=Acetobacterium sp. TaxID=1872094 RepID=UPI002F3E512C